MARSYRTRTLGPSVYRRPAREAFRSRRPRSIPGPLGHVALVVGDPASLNGTDTAWRDWIQDLGFTVELIDDVTAENKDFDLICISESSLTANLGSQKYYPDTAGDPPAILGEQGVWDDWGFGSNGTAVATGTTANYLNDADDYVRFPAPLRGLIARDITHLPSDMTTPAVPVASDSAFRGYVVNVNWTDLQPGASNYPSLAASNPIDTAIADNQAWNALYGANGTEPEAVGFDRKIRVRLFLGGLDYAQSVDASPTWVQTLAGTFEFYRDDTAYTTPKWWTANHGLAYDDLITKLATAYDAVDDIAEITVARAMLNFAEPMVRNITDDYDGGTGTPGNESVSSIWGTGDFSYAADVAAHKAALLTHQAFERTVSTLACNPFQAIGLELGTAGAVSWSSSTGRISAGDDHGLAADDRVMFTSLGSGGGWSGIAIDTWYWVTSVTGGQQLYLSDTKGGTAFTGGADGTDFTAIMARADLATFNEIKDYGRDQLGNMLALGNHSARWNVGTDDAWAQGDMLTMFEDIRDAGMPVYYQTANNTNIGDLGRTIDWLKDNYRANSIEVPSGYAADAATDDPWSVKFEDPDTPWDLVDKSDAVAMTVYSSTQVAYEILDANLSTEGVVPLVDSPGGTGTIVSYRPVGPNVDSLANNPAYSPIIQWGLSGNGPNPSANAAPDHEQFFKDCVLTLTNHQAGAGLWQGIVQRSELAWRANEAAPDTDATTVTSLSNQGKNTEALADGTIDSTPTKELDYFHTGHDAIEFVGSTERIDNSGGLSTAIDTKSTGVTMWWIGEWASFTAASNFVFRLDRGGASATRLSIEKDSTQHFGMRSGSTTSYSASTFSADTPYLIVAYWDPTAVTNNWLEVNNASEMSGSDFTGDTLLDWDVTNWAIPNTGGSLDTSRWHASGVVLGEASASLKADLWTYAQLAVGGAVAISGYATAASEATGDLTATVPISGYAAAASVVAGDLTTPVAISGHTTAASEATADLTLNISVSGHTTAASESTGDLTAVAAVSGYAPASSESTGALSATVPVSGYATAASAATGTLAAPVPVSGYTTAASEATGTPTVDWAISGYTTAASEATGALAGPVLVSGYTTASSTLSGDISSMDAAVSGYLTAASDATAALTATVPVTGYTTASSLASGDIGIDPGTTGSANASSTVSGVLISDHAASGSANSAATADALLDLDGQIDISGHANSSSIATGDLSANVPISSSAGAASEASAALTAIVPVSGYVTAASESSAEAVKALAAEGYTTAASALTGNLTTESDTQLTGSLDAASSATGSATSDMALDGHGDSASDASASLSREGETIGSASAASGATGALIASVPISGSAPTASTADGGVIFSVVLTGSAPSSSTSSGALRANRGIVSSANTGSAASGALVASVPVTATATAAATAAALLVTTGTAGEIASCQAVSAIATIDQTVGIITC